MSEWHAGTRLAIFGARENSLGEAVAHLHDDELGLCLETEVTTFGPGRTKTTAYCDATCDHEKHGPCTEAVHDREWSYDHVGDSLPDLREFDNVVCTIGLNLPDGDDLLGDNQMLVNYHAPLALMNEWARLEKEGHFVVISSNSAHIARSPSLGYCASKAALSMAVRCMARKGHPGIFYAWEFGLLEGTPMTAETVQRLQQGQADIINLDRALPPLTRMRGLPNGIPLDQAAGHVYRTLRYGWKELNGTTLRLDAGEQ